MLADGSYFTVDKGLTDSNLSDRKYFPTLMTGVTVVGPLVISKSTGKAVAITAAPIKKDGKVVGRLGASIYLDKVGERIGQELRLPEGMSFFAIDEHGRTALHSKDERIFQTPREKGVFR